MKLSDVALLAAGALVAGLPIVAYYEARPAGRQSLIAHEPTVKQGALQRAAPNGDESSRTSAHSGDAKLPAGESSASIAQPLDAERARQLEQVQRQLEQVDTTLRNVRQEKRALEAQLRTLQADLAEHQRTPADDFELSQDDWKQLAAKGRIKYRIPCMLPPEGAFELPEKELDELGLTPEDGDTVVAAQRRSNARVWSVVRPLCLEVVELPDVVELLGVSNCLRVIEQAAAERDFKSKQAARRQVAELHAGMRSAPDPELATHPVFAANLALTREAKQFEADLAESFGPNEAHRIARSMGCVMSVR